MKTNKTEVFSWEESDPETRGDVQVVRLSDHQRLQAENEKLTEALKSLIKGYINLLEAGRDRITSLGGDCDPVSVMEHNDPWLRDARNAIAREEVLPK